jgi:uncharacterized protein
LEPWLILAINASPQAILAREKSRIPVDLLKTGLAEEWISETAASGRYYVHFPLGVGPSGVVNFDHPEPEWDWIERLFDECESEFANLHIVFREDWFGKDCSVAQYLDCCRNSILELADRFGVERVIIENSVARADASETEKVSTLGEFFCQIVSETGCGILLDSAHLKITCIENGLDFRQELMRFPLHALREWHITGVGLKPNGETLYDSLPMTEDDWECTAFVAAAIRHGHAARPKIVAIEYGGFGENFEWRSDMDEIVRSCRGVRTILDVI